MGIHFLEEMRVLKRALLEKKMRESSLETVSEEARRAPSARPFRHSLQGEPYTIIGEIKRASPSRGRIRDMASPEEVAGALARGGAAAISVLTEESRFSGSLDDLLTVRENVPLPILRKDFLLHPFDLWESRAAGADCVLLIAAFLPGKELMKMMSEARALKLECLVEVHTGHELDRALEAGADLIGINNRNLSTLEVDMGTVLRLAPMVPDGVTVVAESGYRQRSELLEAREAGAASFLIGETLMASGDVEKTVKVLLDKEV
jgi:indole-3-glycerol phosphate synthase